MICKVCGAQIPDDASACSFCGAKTSEGSVETDALENNNTNENTKNDDFNSSAKNNSEESNDAIFDDNEKRRNAQMKKMMEDKKQQLSEIERRRNEKKLKQRRNRIMLVGAVCALAVGAAGIGAYHIAQNVGDKAVVDESPAPTSFATAAPAPTALPSPTPAISPTPGIFTSPAPNNASSSSGSDSQSWTATGSETSSGGSSSSSGRTSSSSSSSSSSGNSSSSRSSSSSGGSSSSSGNSSAASSSSNSSSGGSSSVSNTGISSAKVTSQLATGGEVILNAANGKHLMTFIVGDKKYYANVSEGSTTEQIKGKPYTVTAVPTSDVYDGNTIYEITNLTNYEGDYILANSGTKLLTSSDISGLSKYDLALARNEIYARHGRKFQTPEYNAYFSGKSWYKINPNYNYSDDNSNLNDTENKNVQFILDAERK